jgi:hypothetical protein
MRKNKQTYTHTRTRARTHSRTHTLSTHTCTCVIESRLCRCTTHVLTLTIFYTFQVIPNKYYSEEYATFGFGSIILSDDPTDPSITYTDLTTTTTVNQATFYIGSVGTEMSFDKPVAVYLHVPGKFSFKFAFSPSFTHRLFC